ncbi:hypothetical protein MMAGJ_69790 [Mycolicibacterium mageritense]|uniref:Mycothiol-dependent maleylpyruvate isomerase metal-binding domain-containing protein n=2 Tax=Mycolicibacterium mageritense TaxID=53462 RepID=A0ABN5YHZ6_MYCME|nr:hypothetical protein MMAGJ_69790 [Mycolicibacterium mageritense]
MLERSQRCPPPRKHGQLDIDRGSFGRDSLTYRDPARQHITDRVKAETKRPEPFDQRECFDSGRIEHAVTARTATRLEDAFIAVIPDGPHGHTAQPRQFADGCAVCHSPLNLHPTGASSVGRMNTDDIWRAVDTERRNLHQLLEPLTAPQWRHASLCEQWRVRDVVAHVVLSTEATVGRIMVNLLRARGSIDRMVCETAIRHASNADDRKLLNELRATIGSRFTAVGTTPTDRLMDLLVHAQDIAVPLGLRHEIPTAAALLALERVWNPRFPFHAAKRLAPYRLRAVDAEWAAGTGPVIEGPVSALLMLATGRKSAALPHLTGDGVEFLRRADV